MIICDICTGRHVTSACIIARDRAQQCVAAGTPDDYAAPRPKLMFPVPTFDELAARRYAIQLEQNRASTRNRNAKRKAARLRLVS